MSDSHLFLIYLQSFFSFPRWFSPSFDNVLFSSSPQELLQSGKVAAKVPILMGLARHEGAFYVPRKLYILLHNVSIDGIMVPKVIDRLRPSMNIYSRSVDPRESDSGNFWCYIPSRGSYPPSGSGQ